MGSNPNDEVGVLQLTGNGTFEVHLFDNQISSLSEDDIYSSLVSNDYEIGCDCKSETDGETNDCKDRSISNYYYCDGTLCTACSLEIRISGSGGNWIDHNTSAVILPQNL